MTWLKLTRKALYLMQSGSSKYLAKADLQPYNPQLDQFSLNVPVEWFQQADAPKGMVISVDSSQSEPEPITKQPSVLDTFNRVITAKEWGAIPKGPFELTTPKYIIIHHTTHQNPPNDPSKGTEEGAKRLAKAIQLDHVNNNKWSDSGQNFLNTTGGFLLEGRQGSLEAVIKGRSVQSAHAKSTPGKIPDGNSSPGIENEGNFMTFPMGQKQWNSLIDLCAAICRSCQIDPENIRGHRDFSQTACPGDWLYKQLPLLRNAVRQKLGMAS